MVPRGVERGQRLCSAPIASSSVPALLPHVVSQSHLP